MLRTLKGKFSLVYLFLVVLTATVGTTAIINLYHLSRSIDGLMTHNYKSINAVTNMVEALEMQDSAILTYNNADRQKGIDLFYENGNAFSQWYNIECNNITEPGEKSHVDRINSDYILFTKLFSQIQEVRGSRGGDGAMDFYNRSISPVFLDLKNELKAVSLINEKAMFNGKDKATKNAQYSINLVLLISAVAVAGGFALSRFFIGKFLKPMHALTQTVRLIKEGNLNHEAKVASRDEIGELALEFNNMTRRLQQYEQSSMGKLMVEKNKSLAIVKSISDPLIVMDTSYKFLLINHACEDFFGIDEEKAINRHFLEVIRNGKLFDYISRNFESREEIKDSIIDIQTGGANFFFNVIVTPVRDIESKLTGLVVTFHNVTELKQLEIMKTDFISTVSHEFKTPLTSIMMGASLMNDKNVGDLNRRQKEIINTIKEDGERLAALVNDLLVLSRIESGKSVFNMQPCSIGDIVLQSIQPLQSRAADKKVRLYFEESTDLPEVNADFEKIKWVLNNLITNALKYTDAGDEIRIRAYLEEGKIFVSVSDNGTGIPKEFQEKIFEKFFQVKGDDVEVRGTGLGLSIVKEIIQVHGGEIWCQSEPDSGSTFTFTLPVSSI